MELDGYTDEQILAMIESLTNTIGPIGRIRRIGPIKRNPMHAEKGKHDFEPKIVAFVCTWCTYAGADLAGTSRLQYPSNVRVVKFPCTGRIDPVFILRAFQKGADGVLVSGCHPGDCHYMAGNFHARRRFAAFRKLLEFIGVDLERLEFSWVSAAEGGKWVEVVTELTERVRAMGPMREFKELEAEEPWSGALTEPELQAAKDPTQSPPASGITDDEYGTKNRHHLPHRRLSLRGHHRGYPYRGPAPSRRGEVAAVVGYRPGRRTGTAVPALRAPAEQAGELFFSPACVNNLALYLTRTRRGCAAGDGSPWWPRGAT